MKMKDIAKELGVSPTTISLTLNGKGDRHGIAAETQARIRAYVASVGYVPDLDAATMVSGGVRQVGVVIHRDSNFFFEAHKALFFGLLKMLQDAGIRHAIQAIDRQVVYDEIRYLVGKKIEDIIFIGFSASTLCETCRDIAPLLQKRRIYFLDYLFTGVSTPERTYPDLTRIGFDRADSFIAAMRLLYQYGHRTVAYADGVKYFLHQPLPAGTPDRLFEVHTEYMGWDSMFEAGRQLLAQVQALRARGCTAVILRDDMEAMGLMTALREQNVRIPEDFSIIGFDNIPASAHGTVPLTTIDVPVKAMLDATRVCLLDETVQPQDIVLPGMVIERASVGPALMA